MGFNYKSFSLLFQEYIIDKMRRVLLIVFLVLGFLGAGIYFKGWTNLYTFEELASK